MTCRSCGATNPIGAARCRVCGRPPDGAPIVQTPAVVYPDAPNLLALPVAPPATGPVTSTKAIVAVVFGVLAYAILPLVGAIVAVILGQQARREIRESEGRQTGRGYAITALILGYTQFAVAALLAFAVCVFYAITAVLFSTAGVLG